MKKKKIIASSILSAGLLFGSTGAFAEGTVKKADHPKSAHKANVEQFKSEISKLKDLRKQNVDLNKQIASAAKSAKSKIQSEIKTAKAAKDKAVLSSLKEKEKQLRAAVKKAKGPHGSGKENVKNAKSSINSIKQAETNASKEIVAKKAALKMIQSL